MKKLVEFLFVPTLAAIALVPGALFAGKSIGITLVNKTSSNNIYLQAPSGLQVVCLETGSFQDGSLKHNVNLSAGAGQSVTGYMQASASFFGGCSDSQSCFDQHLMVDGKPVTTLNFLQAPRYNWGVCCASKSLCSSSESESFNKSGSTSTSASCTTCPSNVSIAQSTCPSDAPSESTCYTITVS